MMLNLNEFKVEDTEIIGRDGKIFKITVEIPQEMFAKFVSVQSKISSGSEDDSIGQLTDIVADIMSIRSSRDDCLAFLKSLDILSWRKVVSFIFNYLTESLRDVVKKKQD